MLLSKMSLAAMGNLGTNYGVLPSDVATAQALSLFNSQVSSVYYDPAYLTKDPRGELTGGLLHGENTQTGRVDGGAAPLTTNGNLIQGTPTQQTLLGMKTNLSSMTKVDHPLYLGFMLGAERFGQELMSFQSKASVQGQSFTLGREPLFLTLGGGTNIVPGIDAGFAARITLHSNAVLNTTSDLAGNTSNQDLEVSAKPVLRPIFGLSADWGKTFCPADEKCWYNGLETAFAFRGYSNTKTTVNSNVTIPGTVPPPGLNLAIATYDAYQPNIYTLGVLYNFDNLRVGVTGEFQQWSTLGPQLLADTIKAKANLQFRDVFVPRIGLEAKLNDMFSVSTGLAYQKSALVSDRSLDVNYLDNDKVILGVGATTIIRDAPIVAYPVRLDLAYQFQYLRDRQFFLVDSQAPTNPYETITSGGRVQVFTASMSLKF